MYKRISAKYCFLLLVAGFLYPGCRKLVTVPAPINSITTAQVFKTDTEALAAMIGVYSTMINGENGSFNSPLSSLTTGLPGMYGGMSADELAITPGSMPGAVDNNLYANNLFASGGKNDPLHNGTTVGESLWKTAYTYIYRANGVIEGIAASTSPRLHDNYRKQLTGEAKFVRAFCYFYLVNFYGDVPLSLTTDFNKTRNLPRAASTAVYAQILQDLQDANGALVADYSAWGDERVRPVRWASMALLARVYLYLGDYAHAAEQASAVIANTGLYNLETDLNRVFVTDSKEAIWQLQINPNVGGMQNATPDGAMYLPNPLNTGPAGHFLSDQLLGSFENGDQRRVAWVGMTDGSYGLPSSPGNFYFPYKYKTGNYNSVSGGTVTENYLMLRLAEQYLIRAEASAMGATGGLGGAIADLNLIRQRAGLGNLDPGLNKDQVLAAVAHERQIELFSEWGHRWLDLKRTGRAHDVLSVIPAKQPWQGDYQLLYPVPVSEILDDHFLVQNPGY